MLEVIVTRHSVRGFLDQKVPENIICELIEALRLAPSSDNDQAWKFIILKGENRVKIASACVQDFVGEAPLIIVALSQKGKDDYNMAFAVENLMLEAVTHGLGTVVIRSFTEETVKQVLSIPDDYHVFCLIPVGYPNGQVEANTRKPVEEIVSWEKF